MRLPWTVCQDPTLTFSARRKCREERIAKLYDIAALLADRKEQVRVRTADQERKLSELEATLAREEQLASRIRNEVGGLLSVSDDSPRCFVSRLLSQAW